MCSISICAYAILWTVCIYALCIHFLYHHGQTDEGFEDKIDTHEQTQAPSEAESHPPHSHPVQFPIPTPHQPDQRHQQHEQRENREKLFQFGKYFIYGQAATKRKQKKR